MAESDLHKRARRLLRSGDRVGQPVGEAMLVVDTVIGGNVLIREGPAKGRQVDAFAVPPEGFKVAVEFKYRHPVSNEKIDLLVKDGRYPVLEIDLPERLLTATDDELREHIAGGNLFTDPSLSNSLTEDDGTWESNRRWLYLPTLHDLIHRLNPKRREAQEWLENHGRDEPDKSWEQLQALWAKNAWAFGVLDIGRPFGDLRCCDPDCNQIATGGGSVTVVGAPDNICRALPRLVCAEHGGHLSGLTYPEGADAFKRAWLRGFESG